MIPLTDRDDVAIRQLLLDCGQEALKLRAQGFEVFEKGVKDYVTSVDRALDQKLLTAFKARFPTDGIITEENNGSKQLFRHNYQHLWFVDPIDGTDDFIQGKSHYSVMVGLLTNQKPQAGWVYAPVRYEMVWGGPSWGLFQQQGEAAATSLQPTPPPALKTTCPIMIGDKDRRRYGAAIVDHLEKQLSQLSLQIEFLSIGSFGLKVIEVIHGRAGLYLYLNGRVKLWDTTGPIALAQAAGLVCCDLDGLPLRFDEEVIDLDTLTHQQAIVIGWPDYVETLLPVIRQAVSSVLS